MRSAGTAPPDPGPTAALGIWPIEGLGTSPVTITGVTLTSAHGAKLTHGVWVTQVINRQLAGVGPTWPPTASASWAARVPAVDAVLKPRILMELVIGLTRTSVTAGRAVGPDITYSTGGSTYTLHEGTSLVLADTC